MFTTNRVTFAVLTLALCFAPVGCDRKGNSGGTETSNRTPGARPAARPSGRLITADDLFGKKTLSGRPPRLLKWSYDGRTLFYLKPSAEDARVLDLWAFDTVGRKASMLVRAADVRAKKKIELTEAQAAARERRRVRHRGITRYVRCRCNTSLLLLAGGRVFHFDVRSRRLKPLLPKPGGELDPKLSADGTRASFVRAGDLYVVDVATGKQRRLTRSGTKTVKNGVAEFVAAEEMDRHTGYWWSRDGRRLAFAQVDESPVRVVLRPKFTARGVKVVRQRYPEAGTANAKVRLGVLDLGSGRVRWIDPGPHKDFYLARVKWVKPGLAFQILTRDQRRLELRLADPATGKSRVVLTETDKHYVNLHKDFRPLPSGSGFLWSSERSGFRQLYLYRWSGKLERRISRQPLHIKKLVGVNEKKKAVFAEVVRDRGRQLQVYRFSLDGSGPPRRVTRSGGWHEGHMNRTGTHFVDRYSDLSRPPSADLRTSSGKKVFALHAGGRERLKGLRLARTTFYDVRANDSTVLNGLLFTPPGARPGKRRPAVMYVYGGPQGQTVGRRWRRMVLWHHYMAQRGFYVFLVDGRGTGGRGKKFETGLHNRFGVADVNDVVAGARALSRIAGVDPHRLGLWGWSYGGYLAVMTVLRTGKLFRAAAAVAPLADWRLYDTAYTERYLGRPATSKEAYRRSNALNLASKLKTDLLLIHGMADDNVLFQNTLLLAEAFQKHRVPFRMMLYPGKKHSIKGTSTRVHLLNAIMNHFRNALGTGGDRKTR